MLTAIIVFTSVPISVFAEEETTYNIGDIIEYGNYPQSKVTDETLISELDEIEKEWKSLNYYSGTGDFNSMTVSDYMKYSDFKYLGEKYRAITFTKYRPNRTYSNHNLPLLTNQYKNKYYVNNIYYFKYESLKWYILNPDTGLIMCEKMIDSQAYQNAFYLDNGYYTDSTCTTYANDYEASSIRQWLNDDFYNSAFTNLQKSNIVTTGVELNSTTLEDNIFILSLSEVNGAIDSSISNAEYTDYSMCQGLSTTQSDSSGIKWWLRTDDSNSLYACAVDSVRGATNDCQINDTYIGVRPVCRLKSLQSDTQQIKGEETNSHISWEYDGNCHLYISGEGTINYADEYGWEKYADEIMYIEISDGITSLPENIFSGLPYLTEVYLGSDIAEISSNAFADCPLLTAVTFNSDAAIDSDAFVNTSKYLTFILNDSTDSPKNFAEQNDIKIVTTSYDSDKKVLNFTGDITVFDYTKYNSLNNILYKHSDTEYLYFTRLIFADANPDINIKYDALEAETTPNGLILNNVYVSLILVNENGEQNVSSAKMIELLESGDYTAFKYKAKSGEKEEEGTLFSKIVERIQRALQVITKLINFIRRLFKR